MKNISVGQKAKRSITFTADHVQTFANLSGDYNPLHFDEDFVKKTKFSKPKRREHFTDDL